MIFSSITLRYEIDPRIWPFALLGVIVTLWAYTRSNDHWIKRLALSMVVTKVQSYRWLLRRHYRFNLNRAAAGGRAVVWCIIASLSAVAVPSFLVCIGVLRNPPREVAVPGNFDPSKFEIVTEGHTIYARPKTLPTTNGS